MCLPHLPFPSKEWGHLILLINTISSLTNVLCFSKSDVLHVHSPSWWKGGARRLCFMSAVNNSEVTSLIQPFKATVSTAASPAETLNADHSVSISPTVSTGMWEKLAREAPNRPLDSPACLFTKMMCSKKHTRPHCIVPLVVGVLGGCFCFTSFCKQLLSPVSRPDCRCGPQTFWGRILSSLPWYVKRFLALFFVW